MGFLKKLVSMVSLSALLGTVPAASDIVVQVGAFEVESEANQISNQIEKAGFTPVVVRPEENSKKGVMYKVLVGDYSTRLEASNAKQTLKAKGYDGFVRTAESFDLQAVAAAIENSSAAPYFLDASTSATSFGTSLSKELQIERRQILQAETTSPATIDRYYGFIQMLPDSSTAKAQDILTLNHYFNSAKRAYSGKDYDSTTVTLLLLKVANGQVAATQSDCVAARAMVSHRLHYYDRDYFAALRAYRQILSFYRVHNDMLGAAKARMEIAATSFELAKASGFDKSRLQKTILALWNEGLEVQSSMQESSDANSVRIYTCRIGLMLTEISLQQKKWTEAQEINESIIAIYEDRKECAGELAEAYCHKAGIEIELNNPGDALVSAKKAIELMDMKNKRQWGDEQLDPLWKAYVWAKIAMTRLHMSKQEMRLLKADMEEHFPGHPGINKLFLGIRK